jgi:hypothetical protein
MPPRLGGAVAIATSLTLDRSAPFLLCLHLLALGCGGAHPGPSGTGPVITLQPASSTTPQCGDVHFDAAAEGTQPLAFQWSRDGVPVPGATSPAFQVLAVTPADEGASFTVTVTNPWGSVSSTPATLSIGASAAAPGIPEVLLASGTNQVAVGSGLVAWTTPTSVQVAPVLCGRPARTIYQRVFDNEYLSGIVIGTDWIAWTDSGRGRVLTTPIAGGDVLELVYTGGISYWNLAATGDQLFWPAGLYGLGTISLTGGPAVTLETGPPGEVQVAQVAADAEYVYWIDLMQHTVNRMPLAGGPVTALASGQGFLAGLTVDDQFVYWASTDETTTPPTGRVNRVSRLGGDPLILAEQRSYPLNLVTDQSRVYWTAEDLKATGVAGTGSVSMAPIDGGGPTTVIADGINPYGIALDATHVYWTESGGSAVGPGRLVRILR